MKTKPKKIKIKKLPKLPKHWDEKGYRYVGALMEDVQSNFRVFGENLELVREKADATFEEVGIIKIQLSEMNMRQDSMETDIKEIKSELTEVKTKQDSMETDIKEIKSELKSIKSEINELKQVLRQKPDLDRLMILEQKVFNLEKHIRPVM